MAHPIRVGVGGWSFDAWDETFYPPGLSKAKQLRHMSRTLTAIEVNATYYSSFKPETFAKWRAETPDGFVFSLKAHRFSTVRKTKEDMAKSTALFLDQGITQLKEKLGPINWQFPGTRKFDAEYFATFLSVLPKEKDGLKLRHALEVRGTGFDDPVFLALLNKHGATVVYAEDDEFPKVRNAGGDFAIARLMQSQADEANGYPKKEIDRFAKMATEWSAKQDVFVFFISGAKERNPAAAVALQAKLGIAPKISRRAGAGEKSSGEEEVMRLNQVTVPLIDYDASVAFYRTLGLKLIVDAPPRYARFEMPEGGSTFSIEKVEGWTGGDWPEVWFESDRLDDLVAELKAKGIVFESEPQDMSYLWRVAHLRDPAGTRITLYHAGENRLNPPWRVK